jgi:hypothetical protein
MEQWWWTLLMLSMTQFSRPISDSRDEDLQPLSAPLIIAWEPLPMVIRGKSARQSVFIFGLILAISLTGPSINRRT